MFLKEQLWIELCDCAALLQLLLMLSLATGVHCNTFFLLKSNIFLMFL